MKTAIDIVLEGVSNGSITNDDAKILLEAINKLPQTVTIPYSTGTVTTKPCWTPGYDPYNQPSGIITHNTDTNNVE